MEVVTLEITGISPLIQNNPAKMLGKPTASIGRKQIPTATEEAEAGVYRLPSGQIYCPAQAVFAALLNASKGRRIGKTALISIMVAAIFPTQEVVLLAHPGTKKPVTEYEIDVRRVMVGKAGVMRARPKITEWQGVIAFEYDTELVRPEQVLEMMSIAGSRIGLLELSPRTKAGQYGRFTATIVNE